MSYVVIILPYYQWLGLHLKWLQSGAPVYDSVQLVDITPISLWFMVPITLIFMGFINHLITGGAHFVCVAPIVEFLDTDGRSEN